MAAATAAGYLMLKSPQSRRTQARGFYLRDDINANRARGPLDAVDRALHRGSVQIGHLLLRDLRDLLLGDLAYLVLVRGAGPLGHARGLPQQIGSRRGLG